MSAFLVALDMTDRDLRNMRQENEKNAARFEKNTN